MGQEKKTHRRELNKKSYLRPLKQRLKKFVIPNLRFLLNNEERMTPSYFIIGGMRCGTTSLNVFMRDHPNIRFATKIREFHYFDSYRIQSEKEYRQNFLPLSEARRLEAEVGPIITGDCTPSAIIHPWAPQRVRAFRPDAKIIALLRDPIDRAVSQHRRATERGRERLPIREAFLREPERLHGEFEKLLADPAHPWEPYGRYSFLARGRYHEQLERWLAVFPDHQFLFIRSEAMFRDPAPILRAVCDFVGIDPIGIDAYEHKNANVSRPVDPDLREMLADTFREPNRRLAELLGPDFDFSVREPPGPGWRIGTTRGGPEADRP